MVSWAWVLASSACVGVVDFMAMGPTIIVVGVGALGLGFARTGSIAIGLVGLGHRCGEVCDLLAEVIVFFVGSMLGGIHVRWDRWVIWGWVLHVIGLVVVGRRAVRWWWRWCWLLLLLDHEVDLAVKVLDAA